jgi:hypothetical protein
LFIIAHYKLLITKLLVPGHDSCYLIHWSVSRDV